MATCADWKVYLILRNFIKAKWDTNVVTTKTVESLEISVTVSPDDPLSSKIAQ